MDNLTHTLTGLVLARAGAVRASRGTTLTLVLASNLPDLDVVAGLRGAAVYLEHHRDLSHSVLGAPLLALTLAGLLRVALRGARLLPLAGCALLGVAVHVFMDLWTSYGTRILAPFDRTWFAWDFVFIVDPYILLLLLVALLLGTRAGPRLASAALAMLLAYVGARALLHSRALEQAVRQAPAASVQRAAALPTPLDPRRWRVLIDTGAAYRTGELRLDRAARLTTRLKTRETAVVTRVRESSRLASVFLDFARFPWLSVDEKPDGIEVRWTDLRFERPGRESFVTSVLVSHDGRILREAFRF